MIETDTPFELLVSHLYGVRHPTQEPQRGDVLCPLLELAMRHGRPTSHTCSMR
jgi:hypothetical protein